MDIFYQTNNKKNNTMSSIPYTQVSTHDTSENDIFEPASNSYNNNDIIQNYNYFNIGEGLYSQLDKKTISSLRIASSWGYFLCFIHLLIGVVLFVLAGVDDYFYLICVAFIAHTFSVCLGIFSVSRKNVLLIINYTIYSVVILAITISVFIISTLVSDYWYSWGGIIGVFFFLNVQIIGIKYLFNLAMNLKTLQSREVDRSLANVPSVRTIPVQTVSQPQVYVQPTQYYYPQPVAQQYYPPQNFSYNYPQSTDYSTYPAHSVHNV